MKKIIALSTALLLAYLFGTPKLSPAGNWYVGGTLYQATVSQWQQASYENRLATAAAWALMQPEVRRVSRESSTMDTIRPYAEELVGCIDKISAGDSYNSVTVSSLAAACMVSNGW